VNQLEKTFDQQIACRILFIYGELRGTTREGDIKQVSGTAIVVNFIPTTSFDII
jgi:hypothetical protein